LKVLKYELFHNSPLARFLLKRAWLSPTIGHALFWHLKADQHIPEVAERITLLLEAFLRGNKLLRNELVKQMEVMNKLVGVAMKIKKAPSAEKKTVLFSDLSKLQLPSKFQLPLDPRFVNIFM
jgi:phosphatidylinositol-4,5-bisphosphate 3-kinase